MSKYEINDQLLDDTIKSLRKLPYEEVKDKINSLESLKGLDKAESKQPKEILLD